MTVAVQQLISPLDTECRDQQINGLARGDPGASEPARMACRCDGEFRIDHALEREPPQPRFERPGMPLVACAAQELEQHEIAQDEVRRSDQSIELIDLDGFEAAEMVDPDGAIGDDHVS